MSAEPKPPLIITGMHRSGTTLIARSLERLGLFIGSRKEENYEAVFFHDLNEWMLRHTNASWDCPSNFAHLNGYMAEHFLRVIDLHMKGLKRLRFLGAAGFARYRDIRRINIPWGWKDPRTTITAGIWKLVFPDARVLHVYRNPIDVAESLRKREEKLVRGFRPGLKDKIKERLLRGRIQYSFSVRVGNIGEGIELWEEYVSKALSLDQEFPGRILHLKYEDFLDSPEQTMKEVATFAGLQPGKARVATAVSDINRDRKFAFIRDQRLVDAYDAIRDTEIMKRLGYHDILKAKC